MASILGIILVSSCPAQPDFALWAIILSDCLNHAGMFRRFAPGIFLDASSWYHPGTPSTSMHFCRFLSQSSSLLLELCSKAGSRLLEQHFSVKCWHHPARHPGAVILVSSCSIWAPPPDRAIWPPSSWHHPALEGWLCHHPGVILPPKGQI